MRTDPVEDVRDGNTIPLPETLNDVTTLCGTPVSEIMRLHWIKARIAVSPILADPDKNNCAEQMHDSHSSGRTRPLNQSEVVRTAGCSCPDRPESGRLQYCVVHDKPTYNSERRRALSGQAK